MSQVRIERLLHQLETAHAQGGWHSSMMRALQGLSAKEACFTPGAGVNSIWQTVNHLAFWKGLLARRMNGAPLSGERIRNDDTFGPTGDPTDESGWQAAVQRLYDAHRKFAEAIAQRTDSELDQPLPGETSPTLGETIKGLILHDSYHLGQIILLRKLQQSWRSEY